MMFQGEVSKARRLDAEGRLMTGRSLFLSLEAEFSLGGLSLGNGLGGSCCRKSTLCVSQRVNEEVVKEVGKAKANLNSDWEALLE